MVTAEQILQLCGQLSPQTFTEEITFPATSKGQCGWNENNNLSPRDGFLRARVEQTVPLTIPAGGFLCSLNISTKDQQTFVYDDHFLIALNDKVLSSSNQKFIDQLEEKDSLRQYEWDRMHQGMASNYPRKDQWNSRTIYCAGTSCLLPPTQQSGTLKILISDTVSAQLSSVINQDTKAELKVVTFGDDDGGADCYHSGFHLTVTGTYVK